MLANGEILIEVSVEASLSKLQQAKARQVEITNTKLLAEANHSGYKTRQVKFLVGQGGYKVGQVEVLVSLGE